MARGLRTGESLLQKAPSPSSQARSETLGSQSGQSCLNTCPPHPATELLILAHHCFTLTCHMEGIIRVLQAARLLTDNHLAPSEEYGLVVSHP